MKIIKLFLVFIVLSVIAFFAFAQIPKETKNKPDDILVKSATTADEIADGVLQTSVWVDGLDTPWALVFIDKDTALVSERSGKIRSIKNGKLETLPVENTPNVKNKGQGGLLDIALDPDYNDNKWVYLTYSHLIKPGSNLAMTKLVRGRIQDNIWVDEQALFEAKPEHYLKTSHHYGSRITFDNDGHVFFSIGERGQRDMAQDITKPNGKIHRLMRDGAVPKDNPFVDSKNAYKSIYSYGNRNPQGLVFTDEKLWETEHGPRGGDELNLIKSGANYGWPVISYGRNYSGTELTPYTHMDGMEQPISQWKPSIAASGLDVYHGDMFPQWNGSLLAGALKYKELRLIKIKDGAYVSDTILLKGMGRVRAVTTGQDGAIYVVLNKPGQIIRITAKDK